MSEFPEDIEQSLGMSRLSYDEAQAIHKKYGKSRVIDAVLSYHMNPATCGVAKFNHALAQRLCVPCLDLQNSESEHPLVSIKPEELGGGIPTFKRPYDLFLHGLPMVGTYLGAPERIYAANSVIANAIRHARPDVIEAWCPSTIQGNPTRGTINVLTFGMAHKIQTARYAKLKTLLDGTGEDYTVSVSTAIHEGSPWDETALVGERLRAIFGDRLRVLGYLADDGLARELVSASAVALFFEPALRANNTTFWAAMNARVPVLTNSDEHSPNVIGYLNIDEVSRWPKFKDELWNTPFRDLGYYGWDRLVGKLRGALDPYEASCAR